MLLCALFTSMRFPQLWIFRAILQCLNFFGLFVPFFILLVPAKSEFFILAPVEGWWPSATWEGPSGSPNVPFGPKI